MDDERPSDEEMTIPNRRELPLESLDPLYTLRPEIPDSVAASDLPTILVDPSEAGSDATLSGSATVPEYRLIERLGRGGMGVVYRARQEKLGRDVAVKTIRPDRSTAEIEEMFSSEARIAGFLDHPNIVPVHELNDRDLGQLFMAMKLVEGRSWHEALRDGDLTTDEHLEILLAVANAVAFAHAHGFIHRDLKPSNVMIGEFGEVLVMDWGLAACFRPSDGVPPGVPTTQAVDSVAGTLRYMAPEMAAAQGPKLGPWSDIYLLGAILYELLAGRPPHEGTQPEDVLDAIVSGRTPAFPTEAPDELITVCRRSMALEPADRYPDVTAFQEAIRAYRSHRESRALSGHAREHLATAERTSRQSHGDRWASGRAYEQSIGGFEQALLLWPENPDAARGLREARLSYARAAKEAGDLALASAQLHVLEGEDADALRTAVEDAIQQRERAKRTTRRLRRTMTAALLFIVVGLVIGTMILERERERADDAARDAALNARNWRGALDDVLRLSDVRVLDDLVRRRDELWPVGPATASPIAAWLKEADALHLRLEHHQRALEKLRRRALEPTAKHRRQASIAELTRLERLQEVATAYRAAADAGDRRARHLKKELESLEEQIADIEDVVSASRPWIFEHRVDQWNHEVLAGLVAGIKALHGDGGPVEQMRDRGRRASALLDVTVTQHAEAWTEVSAAVAADPRFGGLRLKPQIGLVPLGRDGSSGLQEFLHWPSHGGPPMQRDEAQRLRVDEESGLVLVLVPGATVRLGPRKSPNQRDLEGPAHDVELAPFFVSKFEMSQAQWLRATGTNPSFYHPRFKLQSGIAANLMHPVEQVSWTTSTEVLRRLGLQLPTEAQWEYATRAGTDTAWWTGEARESLAGAINIADATARDSRAPWPTLADWPDFRDGFAIHAEVTALRPNPFGLHNVHGNVWEWCKDAHGVYHYPVRPKDGERLPARAHARAMRGGGFTDAVANTRSGKRSYEMPEYQANDLGVRPVRLLDALR